MRSILISTLTLAGCAVLSAQTNIAVTTSNGIEEATTHAVVEADTNAPPSMETHIYSDSWELGIKTRTAIYRGNVRLDDPRMQMTCEQLTANIPAEGKRMDRVVAETNVVITALDDKGLTNRAFADKAVYTYEVTVSGTNETVVLTGENEPRIERPEGVLYGNPIIWDRAQNKLRARNQRMIYWGDAAALTNAINSVKPQPVQHKVAPDGSQQNSQTDVVTEEAPATKDE